MGVTPVKRKLAAILAADAAGYSRLMAGDEEGTMRILSAHRAVIDGIIEFHEGRIVNTAGDSVLAEFASPVQAVRCAVEIQDALRTRNDSLPEDQRLQFRIGVNLGDVMVKGDDLLGDGVNVAARLESVADPGGICVSSSVYDQIAGKLDLGFVDIGAQSLKNIDRPVRVYRIEREGRAVPATGRRRAVRGTGWKWLAGATGLAVLAALAWYLGPLRVEQTAVPTETEERAKVEQQLARARAEARLAKERAKAEARRELENERAAELRAQAEAELARARAEAEAARREAASKLAAAEQVAAAKRQLEEERAANARARAEAELALARAQAEEAKHKAAAELAAAEQARRAAEANAKTATPVSTASTMTTVVASAASLREGRWSVEISCPSGANFRERTITTPVSFANDALVVEHGQRDAPLSLSLRGVQDADGSLWLRGKGVSGLRTGAQTYPAGFFVKPVADRYEGRGRLGKRQCNVIISRAP
jgi:class 3 adenylate cyclase